MVDLNLKDRFLAFVKSKKVAVLSTVSSSNQPMSATIYFVIDDDLNFYFMTKASTRKYKNLQTNKEVSLVIGTDNVPITVQVQGKAERIEDHDEFARWTDRLKNIFFDNKFIAPIFQLETDEQNEVLIHKITPSWIRWLDMTDENEHKGFIQILP